MNPTTKIAIHTTARTTTVQQMLSEIPSSAVAGVHPGNSVAGQPDCFYGWGERQDSGECQRHTIVITTDYGLARALAKKLVTKNYQCVLTGADDWSVPFPGSAACLYRDEHDH